MLSTSDFEWRRRRLERLLQVVSSDFALRVESGPDDRVAAGTVLIDVTLEPSDHDALLGRGLHQITHLLYTEEGAFDVAVAEEDRGKPGFGGWWHSLEDARSANRFIERYPAAGKWFDRAFREALAGSGAMTYTAARRVSLALYLCGRGPVVGRFGSTFDRVFSERAVLVKQAAASSSSSATLEGLRILYPLLISLCEKSPSAARNRDHRPMAVLTRSWGSGSHEPGDADDAGEPSLDTVGAVTAGGAFPWFQMGAGRKTVHPAAVTTDRATIEIPRPSDPERFALLDKAVRDASGGASERVIRLAADRGRIRWNGGQRRGRINGSRLWRHRLGDDALFRRPIADPGEPAIVILLDESASTARGSISSLVAATGLFAAQVLEQLRIPFEMIGYTTKCFEAEAALRLGLQPHEPRTTRCSKLRHRLYKSFDEEFRTVRLRLTAVEPGHNNWDEEHLCFAARRLTARRESRRMILVVGDGQPNGEAAVLRDTVAAIELQGTMVAAVGVGYDYVSRVYPRYRVGTDLPEVLTGVAELIGEIAGTPRLSAGAAGSSKEET